MTERLVTIDRLTGTLRLNDQTTPMSGTLSVERDGTAILRCEPIAFDGANKWLFAAREPTTQDSSRGGTFRLPHNRP